MVTLLCVRARVCVVVYAGIGMLTATLLASARMGIFQVSSVATLYDLWELILFSYRASVIISN